MKKQNNIIDVILSTPAHKLLVISFIVIISSTLSGLSYYKIVLTSNIELIETNKTIQLEPNNTLQMDGMTYLPPTNFFEKNVNYSDKVYYSLNLTNNKIIINFFYSIYYTQVNVTKNIEHLIANKEYISFEVKYHNGKIYLVTTPNVTKLKETLLAYGIQMFIIIAFLLLLSLSTGVIYKKEGEQLMYRRVYFLLITYVIQMYINSILIEIIQFILVFTTISNIFIIANSHILEEQHKKS